MGLEEPVVGDAELLPAEESGDHVTRGGGRRAQAITSPTPIPRITPDRPMA
jgi:hypothetical protein